MEGLFGGYFNDNSSLELLGTANRGEVSKNYDVKLDCNRCSLNIRGSFNTEIFATDSDLDIKHGITLKVKAVRSKMTLENLGGLIELANSVLNILSVPIGGYVEHIAGLCSVRDLVEIRLISSKLEGSRNCLLDVNATKSDIKLIGNLKVDVNVESSYVSAERNHFLKVTGKNARVTVEDTAYHDIIKVPDDGDSSLNKFEISKNPVRHLHNFGEANREPDEILILSKDLEKFSVEFVDRAIIHRNHYKIGEFEFNCTSVDKEEGHYSVQVDTVRMCAQSLNVSLNPGEILLEASWKEKTQKLKMIAPIVSQPDPLKMIFDLKMMENRDDIRLDVGPEADRNANNAPGIWERLVGFFRSAIP